MSAPTWNEEFEFPDESYSISDIEDYFEYILKMHREMTVFFNWDSLHARLNTHYEAWSYKKSH